MKVTHILRPAGIGGIEVMTKHILNFQKKFIDVNLFLMIEDRYIESIGNYFPNTKITYAIGNLNQSELINLWNKHIEFFGQPDIIHSQHQNDTIFFEKVKTNSKKIATLHWTYTNSRQYSFFDAIIGNSLWQEKNIPYDYTGKIFILPNFYLPLEKKDNSKIKKIKKNLNCNKDTFIYGGVGRLTYQKGFDTLCKAFLFADIPNTSLIIVGDSDSNIEKYDIYKSSLNDGRIHFPEFYTNPSQFYHAMDCFVCSSRFESFGLVLIEAMDAGLPIITSDTLGPSDIAKNYNHILFPVDDYKNLAECLWKIYSQGKKRYNYDLTQYNYEKYNIELLNIYKSII